MFILGFAIFLIGVGITITLHGGYLMDYVDLPSLLIIFVPLLAFLTATKSFKVFCAGLRAVILPKTPITEELRDQSVTLFRLLSKTTAIASAIGVLINLLNILMNLDFITPDAINRLGRNIAAALVTMFYGLVLIVGVFEPIVFNLKKQRNDAKHEFAETTPISDRWKPR